MPDIYDVAILGAGPAGATLARLIGNRFSTAVVDKKGTATDFRKPCGGLLSPDAQRALSRFDMTLPTMCSYRRRFSPSKRWTWRPGAQRTTSAAI